MATVFRNSEGMVIIQRSWWEMVVDVVRHRPISRYMPVIKELLREEKLNKALEETHKDFCARLAKCSNEEDEARIKEEWTKQVGELIWDMRDKHKEG